METKNLTIMLTDIKGFTDRTSRQSRSQMTDLLNRHRELLLPVIKNYKGNLVKTIGDAFLVTFESPTDAVLCGVAVQNALRAHNEGKDSDERIEVRIAINAGEVSIHEDGDIYGDAVNITSRIESIAEAGEVFFTEAVYLAMNKKEVPSSEIGYRQFKGVPEKIKVYRVLREDPVEGNGTSPEAVVQEPRHSGITPPPEAKPAVDKIPKAAEHLPAPETRPAGFFRRFWALVLDLVIFFIAAGFLLGSSEPDYARVRVKGAQKRDGKVNISGNGVNIEGSEGERVIIGKNGIEIAGLKNEIVKIGKNGTFVKNTAEETAPAPPEPPKTPDRYSDAARHGESHIPKKAILWILYCALFLKVWGATPGKLILHLKVVGADGKQGPDLKQALLRPAFSIVSAIPLCLGFAWALWEKDGRTWHDIIAGTRVLKSL